MLLILPAKIPFGDKLSGRRSFDLKLGNPDSSFGRWHLISSTVWQLGIATKPSPFHRRLANKLADANLGARVFSFFFGRFLPNEIAGF
jgi:hypothetical protein